MEMDQSILIQGKRYRAVDQSITMVDLVVETVEEVLIFKK